MSLSNGGKTPYQRSRQAAIDAARRRVLASYNEVLKGKGVGAGAGTVVSATDAAPKLWEDADRNSAGAVVSVADAASQPLRAAPSEDAGMDTGTVVSAVNEQGFGVAKNEQGLDMVQNGQNLGVAGNGQGFITPRVVYENADMSSEIANNSALPQEKAAVDGRVLSRTELVAENAALLREVPATQGTPVAEAGGLYDAPAAEVGALKDVPVNQEAVDAEWAQYHSAWQKYYQEYYSEYYSQAAQSYVEQEKRRVEQEAQDYVAQEKTRAEQEAQERVEYEKAKAERAAQDYLATEKLKVERTATGNRRRRKQLRKLLPLFVVMVGVLVFLFLQYNRLIFAPIMAYLSPASEPVATEIVPVDPSVVQAVSPEPRLIIPKLNVDVPVAFGIHYDDVMAAMNHGVAQFKIPGADAMPGQVGNLVISGHSAGDIYSSNPYKFIFSGLERLEVGDLIYINYESVRYTYRMTGREVVAPSNVGALIYTTTKPMLTLITCTPLGTSRDRLLISAEQISPAYESGVSEGSGDGEDYVMPENEPTLLDQIFR